MSTSVSNCKLLFVLLKKESLDGKISYEVTPHPTLTETTELKKVVAKIESRSDFIAWAADPVTDQVNPKFENILNELSTQLVRSFIGH